MSVQVKDRGLVQAAYLEQASGPERGRMFEIRSPRLTLGRADENDIVISAEGVSRVHALLVNSEGAWFIRDNNSKNGIYVNGKQVKESWLETGDTVQLGTFLFRFDSGEVAAAEPQGNLPDLAQGLGGGLAMGLDPAAVGMPASKKKGGGNPRIKIYLVVLLGLGAFLMMGSPEENKPSAEAGGDGATGEVLSARDFKTSPKPDMKLGTNQPIPSTMEDPLLKKAEQDMAKLDWSNNSLRQAEQFFRKGQREYMSRNFHRAMDSFQTALSLYGGHLLAERYLRRAIFEAEVEAKTHMASAVRYYESLQYARSIYHFNEVIALMSHRPEEPIVKTARSYVKQAELRLQAAELFP